MQKSESMLSAFDGNEFRVFFNGFGLICHNRSTASNREFVSKNVLHNIFNKIVEMETIDRVLVKTLTESDGAVEVNCF